MNSPGNSKKSLLAVVFLGLLLVTVACVVTKPAETLLLKTKAPEPIQVFSTTPQRPVYRPGELVAYTAQSGDNLLMLAARFNTSELAIRNTNPILPPDLTTLPPGLPLQIPIYYLPFWGSAFKMLPNSAFVYTEAVENKDFETLLATQNDNEEIYQQLFSQKGMPEKFNQFCLHASVDPRLVLSLIAYGLEANEGLEQTSLALVKAALKSNFEPLERWLGILNEGYYRFEVGRLVELELPDGTLERLDPWQNAGSAALRYFFSHMLQSTSDYYIAVEPNGFANYYQSQYGDPWAEETEVLPGSLDWISAGLPINPRGGWQAAALPDGIFTGMPKSGVMAGFHASSRDCKDKNAYGEVFASIGGVITRLDASQLVLSQQGLSENQGWSLVYYGLTVKPSLKVGDKVEIGQSLGHVSSGVWGASFWLARKFNGEWVGADGVVPFTLGGWKLAIDKDGRNLTMQKPEMTVYSQPSKSQTNLIPSN